MMRPVIASNLRLHPNYPVDPATNPALQAALNRLLFIAQQQMLIDNLIAQLRAVGTTLPQKQADRNAIYDFSAYPTALPARLTQLNNNVAAILALAATLANNRIKIVFLNEMNNVLKKQWSNDSDVINVYTRAHDDLINTLGYYCSYCGVPVSIGVHVEHKMPKASYPNLAVIWDNFLLACDNCNSSKGEKPNRITGAQTVVYAIPPPPLNAAFPAGTENNIQTGSSNSYVWADDPNYTHNNAFTFRLMRVSYTPAGVLGAITRTGAVEIPPADLEIWAKNAQVRRLPPYTGKIVIGSFGSPLAPQQGEVELWVTATGPFAIAAQTVINELHFNRDQNDLRWGFNSDLRVPLRTDAWFKAVIGIPRLIIAYLADRGNFGPVYQALENTYIESAASSGFWLVWVKVITLYIDNENLRRRLLLRFLDPAFFPGTRNTFAELQ